MFIFFYRQQFNCNRQRELHILLFFHRPLHARVLILLPTTSKRTLEFGCTRSNGNTSELLTVDDDAGPVTSVKWASDGRHISVGLNNSDVHLWDSASNKLLRALRGCHQSRVGSLWDSASNKLLRGCHQSRVGSLDWNNHILTTGGMDDQQWTSHYLLTESKKGKENPIATVTIT
ncbi:hypothetical protein QVD17_14953 [Tagetes erecta]|uniref:Anaphase-promoting complex subunit 4-like WD40 domain-containing protein n=1 Tax=Tagetes erecta TaxID=13708 RepID=A0AAD8KU07_TARER|nr:hypothetical protein QVD17_14953 [Tagetes erecta]